MKGTWNLWGRKYTLWALVEAYESTGDGTALRAAERTTDQLIAMLDRLKLSVRAHGTRHGTAPFQIGMRHHCCCVDNSPRGFYDMAEHALVRRGDVVEVNHYLPCAGDLGGGISVTVGGNYPVSETVTLDVRAPASVTLSLRVPGWCPELTVDGRPVSPKGGRAEIAVASPKTLSLRFRMPVRIVRRPDLGEPALPPGYESRRKASGEPGT